MYITNQNVNTYSTNFKSKGAVTQKKLGETMQELATRLIEKEKTKLDFDKNVIHKLLLGFSQKEISEKMGISSYKISEISTKYKTHKIYIQRRNAAIADKLKNGLSRKTVMKRTVQKVAEANNAFAEKVKNRDELILEKIKSGMEGKQVAKELGVSEATVMRAVQKLGLKIRELRKLAKD